MVIENDQVLPSRKELKELRSLLIEAQEARMRLIFQERQEKHCSSDQEFVQSGEYYKKEIERNLARCTLLCGVIQHFINSIDDSLLRRIFTDYYIYGWRWQKIAVKLGGQSESTPRIMHRRYLERLERMQKVSGKEKNR